MGLASSRNKNVIRFLLRWIYTFLLEPEICCAVQGSTMEKYIIRLPIATKYSNKILSHPGYSARRARCDPVDSGRVERGWSLAVLPLSEALPVPRAAAACGVIPILPNPWNWWLTVSVEQSHSCHSAQFTRVKWGVWCVPPARWCADQGRCIGCSVQSSDGKTKNIKPSQWFQHLSCTFPFHWTSGTGRLYTLAQKYCMLFYVLLGFFNLVSFFENFLGNLFPLQLFPICIFAVYFM